MLTFYQTSDYKIDLGKGYDSKKQEKAQESVTEESPTCNMFMQCNINGPDKVTRRLCINVFNCATLGNKQVIINDSLIDLLRDYSGYYNYFESERLRIFEELEKIGVPPGYKDLSELDKSSNKDFARIIIRPETYNR